MKLHHLFIVIGIISSGTSRAQAEEHDGWAVGARAEGGVYGPGADYWRGPLAITATVGAAATTQRGGPPGTPAEMRAMALGGSLGGLVALAQGPRSRLALGVRAVYGLQYLGAVDLWDSTYQSLALQLPLRIQVWVADRIALHTEVGLELGVASSSSTTEQGNDIEASNRSLGVFGNPLGNFGVSYCF
jgi:hypothetical protein